MEEKPLVSIIVPIFNAEKYLSECIDSILNQTYKNIEIILIDDGSTDKSAQICDAYTAKDKRAAVVHKTNEGVSAARNDGLKAANGQFVMFVDSDDWIDPETCDIAVRVMEESGADVVMWTYISENSGNQSRKIIFGSDTVFEGADVKEKLHRRLFGLMGKELAHPEYADSLCPVWGKLYKKEIILNNNASFVDLSEIGTYEDGLFNIEVFSQVLKAVYLNKCLYHYRKENSSSVTSVYRKDLFEKWYHLFDLMQEYIDKNCLPDDYQTALNNRIALSILGLGLNIMSCDCRAVEKIKMIKKIIKSDRYKKAYKDLCFTYFPGHWKLFYGCAKYNCAFGVYILLLIIQKILSR